MKGTKVNINRLSKTVACAIVVGGAILFAAPAHAEENTEPVLTDETSAPVDPCSQEFPPPECTTDTPLAEEPAPAASFVSFCESVLLRNDGNVGIVFTIGDTPKGGGIEVPAYESRSAMIHFNEEGVLIRAYHDDNLFYEVLAKLTPPCIPTEWEAPTQTIVCGGVDIINVPVDTYEVRYNEHGGPGVYAVSAVLTYDDRVLQTWEFYESEEGCAPTVVNVAYECVDPVTGLGRFTATIEAGSQQINGWSILIDNLWVGAADGTQTLVIDTKYLSAGTYDWIAGIDLFPGAGANAEGTVEVTSECMVAVGEPPVPPTTPTTPVEEPEIKALETSGHCRTFTVTNVGTVPTSDGMTGVALIMGNQPPGIIGLEPGQSHSYELAVGQTASLGFSDGEVWTVDGPLEFTAESCVVEYDLGDDVVEQYVEPVTVDPASVMLPATGYKSAEISLIAAGVLGLGAALSLAARRRPVM